MQLHRNAPDVIRKQRENAIQAVVQNDVQNLAPLIRRGLDVNFRDTESRTLLFLAKDLEVTEWLIEHGADVNVVDHIGETPLTIAARYGRAEIVKRLIAAKADLNPRSKTIGQTPLAEAQSRGDDGMTAVLRQAGAKE